MTIKEIAQLAGVSVSTVSKVMNGKDAGISAETRARVLEVAKQYHYKPYAAAMQRDARTLVIGVLVPSVARTRGVVSGICAAARDNGYSVLLEESGDTASGELRGIVSLMGHRVDGVLWMPLADGDPAHEQRLRDEGVPYVTFGPNAPGGRCVDYAALGYAATEELVGQGHATVACMFAPSAEGRLFRQGYRQCLFDSRLPQDEALEHEVGRDDQIPLGVFRQADALVTSDFSLAVRAWRGAVELGHAIPRDLSLVSLRDDAYEDLGAFPLSSIAVPTRAFGSHLAESLIADIEKREGVPPFETTLELDTLASVGASESRGKKRIVSFGSINIDNYLSFDVLPNSGTSASTSRSSTYPGGKCLNEAIGAARLGQSVSAIGRVGDDADADVIYETLSRAGVDASAVQRTADCKTGQAYIFVEKTGASMISIMSGANGAMRAEDALEHEGAFRDASICLLQTEVPIEAVSGAAAVAKSHGLTTILKPSACAGLPAELLSNIDILVPNLDELGRICPNGETVDEKVRALMAGGAGTVIVTRGEGGCSVFDKDAVTDIPALDVNSVDNTGAGDAFISALASYLLLGYDLVRSARIATYAAGLSTLRQGVTPSLVDRDTLEAYLMQHEPNLLQNQGL